MARKSATDRAVAQIDAEIATLQAVRARLIATTPVAAPAKSPEASNNLWRGEAPSTRTGTD